MGKFIVDLSLFNTVDVYEWKIRTEMFDYQRKKGC